MNRSSNHLSVSAIVLTFNSARTLAPVLKSLAWCEEILVVDSGSTDDTIAIAKSYNARIVERKFTGFGDQKNTAVSLATFDWVFVVDSDEVVSDELRDEIRGRFLYGHEGITGYLVSVRLVFLGEKIRFSGSAVKHVLRLFNRQDGNYNQALVHEMVDFTGITKKLHTPLWHYSYLTLEDYFNKFNRYTSYGAEELFRIGKVTSPFKIWTSFPFHFIRMYLFKLGILDGYHGFLWCLFSAISPVVKHAKLKELRRESEQHARGSLKCI